MFEAILKLKLHSFTVFILGLFCCLSCSFFMTAESYGLTDQQYNRFATNNILFYDPSCLSRGIDATSCFKIDTTVSASDQWYAEGCLDNGGCSSGIYYASNNSRIAYTKAGLPGDNSNLLSETEIDDAMGGMQYIYAENYDIEYNAINGWIPKFTKNGGNSTQKYYWIVLPAEAYSTGFGETYVATFENVNEPIYFITYDTHACQHQSEKYCEQAKSNPDGTAIGKEFFGAFTKNGGSPSEVVKKLGKLKSFCRIKGGGDISVHESGTGTTTLGSGSTTSTTSTTSTSSSNSDDDKKCAKLGELRKKMWDEASDADKESFMKTVSEEVYDIAGVEIYMNQIISKHGSDGSLHDWLTGQCERYRPSSASCTGKHTITAKEQGWIDEALSGSNHVKFAIGNATGGSSVGAGKIVCVWDGSKCRDDVDYDAQDGKGKCNVYSPSSSYGECLGLEDEDDWAEDIGSDCGANCNSFEGDYPQYFQGNYGKSDHENSSQDWTKISYGSGTVATSGCGPTSMAMLTTVATGTDVYPQDIIKVTKPTGSYTTTSPTQLDSIVGEKYGFEVIAETYSSKSDAYNKIKKYLNDGYMIHLSGEGSHEGFSKKATAGHYVGLFNIDGDDNVQVANSNSVGNNKTALQNIIDAIHNGVFTAIKGGGSSGSACSEYCPDEDTSSSVGEEGLTFEQAKQFMMNYGENKNNSSRDAVGSLWDFCNGGGSNCVTFSAFFMYKFTDIPNKGATGNGNQLVDTVVGWNVGATRGTEPKVFSILSTDPNHTAVVLGHHGGKWIIGHASCHYSGRGKGNGGNGSLSGDNKGGGSGFVALEDSDNPADWQWVQSGVRFAYPKTVYTDKIEEYLKNGV